MTRENKSRTVHAGQETDLDMLAADLVEQASKSEGRTYRS